MRRTACVSVVLFLGIVALLVAGCGNDDEPSRSVAPDESGVDVIVTALDTMFTWYPGRDGSSRDAYERASPYLTPELANLSGDGDVQPTAQWLDWETRQAIVTAESFVVAGEHPPDTTDRVTREAVITQTVTDRAGAKESLTPLNAHVTAIRTEAGWRVSALEIQ